MLKEIKQFLNNEEGASAIEYGLIVGLIAVVMIVALIAISGNLETIWNAASGAIATGAAAVPAPGG